MSGGGVTTLDQSYIHTYRQTYIHTHPHIYIYVYRFSSCSGIFALCQSSESSGDSPAVAADEERKADKGCCVEAHSLCRSSIFHTSKIEIGPSFLSSNLC